MSDPFADIRPYRDHEVVPVLQRLLADAAFLDTIAAYRLGWLGRLAPPLSRLLVRRVLRREVAGVTDVRSMQEVIEAYMNRMIERSTGGFSVSGLEGLRSDVGYLYVSNHRDIAMDPAFTNLALHRNGRDTVRIAIGDNLLTQAWVSDLMRLNKSFIVRRSLHKPRELLAASRTLSAYIRQSVLEDNAPVWIAQREGRAKDGVDRSEPVLIKMLGMSRDKQRQTFAEHIRSLRIVPVAISYELDPCDAMKANELHQLALHGSYHKGEGEDIESIGRGIAGQKGQVHVAFGRPLEAGLDSPEAVAAAIDRQIIRGYCLHPTNVYAWRRLYGADATLPAELSQEHGDVSAAEFNARIDAMPEPHRPHALAIYANAVVAKLEAARSPC